MPSTHDARETWPTAEGKGSESPDWMRYMQVSLTMLAGTNDVLPVANFLVQEVKCDEARPACLRCTSTGRKCDGYEVDPPNALKPVPQSAVAVPATLGSLYATSPEARSFQFFTEKTLAGFQTFFRDDLWSSRVLQVAQSTDCIRHAVVALASYHERYLTHDQAQLPESTYGLSHYNRAIRELLTPSSHTSFRPHVLILSCIIFVCIEVGYHLSRTITPGLIRLEILQGKTESAIGLFKYGCKMIQQSRATSDQNISPTGYSSHDAQAIFRLAEAIFKRIAVQISMLVGDVDTEVRHSFYVTFSRTKPLPGLPFKSLAEAREALLDMIVEQASPGLRGLEPHNIAYHSANINQWCQSFDALVADYHSAGKTISSADRRAMSLLQLHRQYLEINVAKCLKGPGDPCFWDRFTGLFEEMVGHATIAAGLDETGGSPREIATDPFDPSRSRFHIDIGISAVLFSMIARCRDPIVRRKAIAVMRADQALEGVWNGPLTARTATRLVELEESRSGKPVTCSDDIPAEARVRDIRVHLWPGERKADIVFRFDDHDSCEETVEW
ncbi:hypothetical protein NM208_g6392 [Fusarium decemcellulare]|uniref:Uncharacterized protein n=1 Tax=Fusarium decemcellulare TaxID=57161 RepID=A0ACC1SD39_9HYPO|nr:hypothetical protein NM208_g6392 [Fusarium decemcellulare]